MKLPGFEPSICHFWLRTCPFGQVSSLSDTLKKMGMACTQLRSKACKDEMRLTFVKSSHIYLI